MPCKKGSFAVKLVLLVIPALLVSTTGCAFIPTPVRLLDKPRITDQQPAKNVRVCVIVKDERPESIQKCNMCGLMRNLYWMPTSFALLAHREHLDEVVACHVQASFEHLGYTVVDAYPKPPAELSTEKVKAKEFDKKARSKAWSTDRKSQDDPDARKRGLKGAVENLEADTMSPWGEEIDVSRADIVVEIKIRKFWSDMGWPGIDVGGVFAWMSANMAVCDARDSERKVVFGKKVKGFGHGRGLTPIEAYGIPVNMAYWFVLHGIEKAVASEEFNNAVVEIKAAH